MCEVIHQQVSKTLARSKDFVVLKTIQLQIKNMSKARLSKNRKFLKITTDLPICLGETLIDLNLVF